MRSDNLSAAAMLVGRLLLSAIFIHEGWGKIANYAGAGAYMKAFGLPAELLPAAIALELGGGLAILLGLYTRLFALLLGGFCIVTALLFHNKLGEINQLLHFEKDLAIAGGFLVLAAVGAGRWSLDARYRGKD